MRPEARPTALTNAAPPWVIHRSHNRRGPSAQQPAGSATDASKRTQSPIARRCQGAMSKEVSLWS